MSKESILAAVKRAETKANTFEQAFGFVIGSAKDSKAKPDGIVPDPNTTLITNNDILRTVDGAKVYYAFQGALAEYADKFKSSGDGGINVSSSLPQELNNFALLLAVDYLTDTLEIDMAKFDGWNNIPYYNRLRIIIAVKEKHYELSDLYSDLYAIVSHRPREKEDADV